MLLVCWFDEDKTRQGSCMLQNTCKQCAMELVKQKHFTVEEQNKINIVTRATLKKKKKQTKS